MKKKMKKEKKEKRLRIITANISDCNYCHWTVNKNITEIKIITHKQR